MRNTCRGSGTTRHKSIHTLLHLTQLCIQRHVCDPPLMTLGPMCRGGGEGCTGWTCRVFNLDGGGGQWSPQKHGGGKDSIDTHHSGIENRYRFVSCSCLSTIEPREGKGYVAVLVLPHHRDREKARSDVATLVLLH